MGLKDQLAEADAKRLGIMAEIAAQEDAEIQKLNAKGQATDQAVNLVKSLYDSKRVDAYVESVNAANTALGRTREEWEKLLQKSREIGENNKEIEEGTRKLEAQGKAVEKLAERYNELNSKIDQQRVQHQQRMIGIQGASSGPVAVLGAQQDIERQDIEDRYNNSLKTATSEMERANLKREKALELDRLDYEMEEAKAQQRQKGVVDFFREMAQQSQTAGNILNQSMHSALDQTSDQLSKLITGKKTQFGKMLDEIGTSMLRDAIKSGMHQGLGKLEPIIDKVFNPNGAAKKVAAAANQKDLQTQRAEAIRRDAIRPIGIQSDPIYVSIVNGAQGSNGTVSPAPTNGTAGVKTGSMVSTIGGLIQRGAGIVGRILGGGSQQGTASSTINFGGQVPDSNPGTNGGVMGYGGSVSADQAYIVGDKGPEILTGASGRIISNANARDAFGGGTTINNNVDARGADLGAAARINRGLEATHDRAVSNAQTVAADRKRRTPQRAA